ncbi:MAG: cytochrome P450, partial [Acidimicrobiia bacterium]
MSERRVVTVSTYAEAREVYRQKSLRQALYDAGDVVMADVLVNLHGARHRDRRRLENRLFRKDTHARYERELLPPVVDETLAPYVADGHAELVSLSHQMMMNLAALAAGVDRPLGTPEETFHLYSYLMLFIEGATLGDFTGDRDAKRAEVAAALCAFDAEFLQPSIAARRSALARFDAGEIVEGDVPRDVLTILLRNHDNLELPSDV